MLNLSMLMPMVCLYSLSLQKNSTGSPEQSSDQSLRLDGDGVCLQVNPIVAADVCDKLLEACARLAEAELAVQVAQSMRGLGIPVGYVAHGCVLRALCMAGGHEVSERVISLGVC